MIQINHVNVRDPNLIMRILPRWEHRENVGPSAAFAQCVHLGSEEPRYKNVHFPPHPG